MGTVSEKKEDDLTIGNSVESPAVAYLCLFRVLAGAVPPPPPNMKPLVPPPPADAVPVAAAAARPSSSSGCNDQQGMDMIKQQMIANWMKPSSRQAPPAVKTGGHWMGCSHQLQMCVVDDDGVFQDTLQLIIKAQLGRGGNSRVFRVAKVPKAGSSSGGSGSSGTGVDGRGAGNQQQQQDQSQQQFTLAPEPSDLALKAADFSDPSLRQPYMCKTLKEFSAAHSATGLGAKYVVVPEAVGYLQCANGEEWPCLLMELAPHGCLQDVICPGGVPRGIPPAAAAHAVARVLQALEAIHEGGIIHRDVKPHNVLLFGIREDPIPKLADFGEAGFISNTKTTQTRCLGTPWFQTKEMLTGGNQDSTTDVALLALMYLALRWGFMPFSYLDIDTQDTSDEEKEKTLRSLNPLAELERADCPYNQDPGPSGGPPKLNEVEKEFLKKCLHISPCYRKKSGDFLTDPLMMQGMRAKVGYW